MTPVDALQKYFGYSEFRVGQLEIIESLVQGRDTLALMPTGGGKSICFQVPALLRPGTCVVVSPLISLMKDQVDTLNRKGISATYINSSLDTREVKDRLLNVSRGQYKFVYVAPERLTTTFFQQACANLVVNQLIVDEAHCISQWGHDFRPEYLQIDKFVTFLPKRPPVGAFTATATSAVQNDIAHSLKLSDPQIFTNSFQRSNLQLRVITCHSRTAKDIHLLHLLQSHLGQAGVIYTMTREAAENLAEFVTLMLPNLKVTAYHGGLSSDQRSLIQEQFLANQLQVIVATNAFGMGVDKANVRFVIHYQLPSSLEHYYQEAGRAGRDGHLGECYVLFHQPDFNLAFELGVATSSNLDPQFRQSLVEKLKAIVAYTRLKSCRMQYICQYFGESNATTCGQCDRCQPKDALHQEPEKPYYQALKIFITQLSRTTHQPKSYIASEYLLHWLVLTKPKTVEELLKIPGVGKGWVELWAEKFHSFSLSDASNP